MTPIRRLDHIGIVVRDTESALRYFSEHLGLLVVHEELLDVPPVRLTYLESGNAFIQLIEPRRTDSELSRWLEEHGEGVHHLCFGVDDVSHTIRELSGAADGLLLGQGRGRVSGFFADGPHHGVWIECTEFHQAEDVDRRTGWLDE
jgi:methylmalonyl-CoA/ethylmalonyl-CoA epimerase